MPAVTAPTRPLSDRAKARLRIAATLMRWRAGEGSEIDHQRVLCVIESLDATARERLRACVDWVEAYERQEATEAVDPLTLCAPR
jgi:hypothetical protein